MQSSNHNTEAEMFERDEEVKYEDAQVDSALMVGAILLLFAVLAAAGAVWVASITWVVS
jgi:hypothetical protein